MTLFVNERTNPTELGRTLFAGYLDGFSTITISSKKPILQGLRKAVITDVGRMMGFEVVEEKPENIVLQDFFSQTGLSIEKTLKRAHMISSNMQLDFAKAIKEGNLKLLHEMLAQEDEVDRLAFLIWRQLRCAIEDSSVLEVLKIPSYKIIEYYICCSRVERVADNFYRNAQELIAIPASMPVEGAVQILAEADKFSYGMHSGAMKAFFENDKKTANRLLEENDRFQSKKTEMMKKLLGVKKVEPMALTMLARYYDIANLGRDMAETVLDIQNEEHMVSVEI